MVFSLREVEPGSGWEDDVGASEGKKGKIGWAWPWKKGERHVQGVLQRSHKVLIKEKAEPKKLPEVL